MAAGPPVLCGTPPLGANPITELAVGVVRGADRQAGPITVYVDDVVLASAPIGPRLLDAGGPDGGGDGGGEPGDAGPDPDAGGGGTQPAVLKVGCGCSAAGAASLLALFAAMLAFGARRRAARSQGQLL